MFFIFKKTTIVVDCLIDDPGIFENTPIVRASETLPQWWKDMPNTFVELPEDGIKIERPTIKRCDAIANLYRNGFVLPNWTSLKIKTSDTQWRYRTGRELYNNLFPPAEYHYPWQYGNAFNNKLHFKLSSPWFLKEKTGCEFHMSPATWGTLEHWTKFTILPGVVDFKHQHSTNVNFFLEKNQEMDIEIGTPLYHIIPITDKKVIFKNHLVETEEIKKLIYRRWGGFNDSYKILKQRSKDNVKKCPFKL